MKPDRKLEIVAQAIHSLSTHDDEDAAVIEACLDQVIALCEREKGNPRGARDRAHRSPDRAPEA